MRIKFGIVLCLSSTVFVHAGSLTPPGAPAPTMKTLDEVEARTPIHAEDIPLTITQPGSYYLAEDVHYTSESNGITISNSFVTIDLNGFTLRGPGATGSAIGIAADFSTSRTVIRNGMITDWPYRGLYLPTFSNVIEKVNVSNNGDDGIALVSGHIINCVVSSNGADGILFFANSSPGGSSVSGCTVFENATFGIITAQPTFVSNNIVSENTDGIGIGVGGSRVENNNIFENTDDGIAVNDVDSIIIKNTAWANGTNYLFSSSAIVGPIIDMSAGGTIATNNPWANFSY